jgi:transcriptional regulator with XRE-family HTH domain
VKENFIKYTNFMDKYKEYDVGLRIRTLRKERNLSQEKLALLTGISPTYLGQLERNTKNPTLKTIEKICFALDISLKEFFDDADKPNNSQDSISKQISVLVSKESETTKNAIITIIKQVLKVSKEEK